MGSFLFDSFWDDVLNGNITVSTDTFYVMLITSSATPSKASWAKRSDVTNETSGTGYTAGGQSSAATITAAAGNSDKETINFADVTWGSSTISAAFAVIYKHRGGLATADNLVGVIDFGGTVSDVGGTFTFHMTAPFGVQN